MGDLEGLPSVTVGRPRNRRRRKTIGGKRRRVANDSDLATSLTMIRSSFQSVRSKRGRPPVINTFHPIRPAIFTAKMEMGVSESGSS